MNRLGLVASAAAVAYGATASNSDLSAQYEELVREHGLILTPSEREFHFKNFEIALESGLLSGSASSVSDAFLDARPAVTEHFAASVAADASFDVNTSFFKGRTVKEVRKTMGTHIPLESVAIEASKESAYPKSFSSIEKWGSICPSIGFARDQGNCGSCWAMAGTATFNDRYCIATNGEFTKLLSTNYILACSMYNGCNGGQMSTPFSYINRRGVPTGSEHVDVDDGETCQPYDFHRCGHHMPSEFNSLPSCSVSDVHPESRGTYTPQCKSTCSDKKYPKSLSEDLHYGGSAVRVSGSVDSVKKAIIEGGPVAGAFNVHEDFLLYNGGTYKVTRQSGGILGGHAIKVVGWGVDENGVEYWDIMNSWNEFWGIEGGRFHAEISSFGLHEVFYSNPDLKRSATINSIRM